MRKRLPQRDATFSPPKSKYFLITRKIVLIILLFTLLGLGAYAIYRSGFFNVNSIDCTHDYQPCKNPFLISELDKSLGINIFQVDTGSIEQKILEGDKTIGTAKITRSLPSTLSVEIFTRTPKIAVRVKEGQDTWLVFSEDYLLLRTMDTDPNLPTVYVKGIDGLQVGEHVKDKQLSQSLKLALLISDNFIRTKSIELNDFTITLTLVDGQTVLMSTRKDISEQIGTLQQILQNSTIVQDKEVIDIRFNQPVLK